MKSKILNLCLIVTPLVGYLEWGTHNKQFLFEVEGEVLMTLFIHPGRIIHPFIILPLFGQLILIMTLFQQRPAKILSYIGLGCIGLLLFFMFVIGLMSLNLKILISTLPFILSTILVIKNNRKNKMV